MIKIGIIGSDNSHALAFAKLVNIKNEKSDKYNYPDIKINAIYGHHDDAHTKNVADEGQIEKIYKDYKDMADDVDAVMIVFRDGTLHYEPAKFFLEKGVPAWIDKPFTVSSDETKNLLKIAKEKNVLLTGGSTVKYAPDVLRLKDAVQNDGGLGNIIGGYFNFPGDISSEYCGIFFYGPHTTEMVTSVYGNNIVSVKTILQDDRLIAVAKYKDFDVIMNFIKKATNFVGIVYGDKKTVVRDIDISTIYIHGFNDFYEKLIYKMPVESHEDILAPILLLNAIEESYKTGKEVFI